MAIEINTQIIHASYATVIQSIDAEAHIYDNPNQQGTTYPAWFIVHRSPVELQKEQKRFVLVYQIDLWYMLPQNKTQMYDKYTEMAEKLDQAIEYLPIFGTDGVVVHVYDRSWGLEMNALKYSTTLRLRVSKGTTPEPFMQVIEDLHVFLKNMNIATVTFTNTTYPEFEVELPDPMATDKGDFVKLPYMSGAYEKDDETYVPYCWDIGEFGQNIQVNENMVANLEWKVAEIVTLVFTNTDYPEFDISLPDSVVIEKGTYYTLPILSGEYTEGGKVYEPNAWSIGGFGEAVIIDEDTTANLIWIEKHVGPEYPQGQFTYGEMKTNIGKQVELNAISFNPDECELMNRTGSALFNLTLSFISDVSLDYVMSLNGLMTVDE